MKRSQQHGFLCLITTFICICEVVLSCSSKSAQTKVATITSTTSKPHVIEERLLATGNSEEEVVLAVSERSQGGVWEAEGDPSSISAISPPANGPNEELLTSKPTQEDTGISQRLAGSETDENTHLSQQFHKSHKPLTLAHFNNKSIQCNDKTTAGYYVRNSSVKNSNIWIIFLEGGWFCFDVRSCQNRWLRLKNLMSSSSWPYHKHVGGILSADPNENPYWWNANHVFVPYCSSDTWSGTSKGDENGSKFSFMGALIIEEVIKTLIRNGGLRADSTVILAGSSAGGTGVLINLDRVDDILTQKFGNAESGPPRVRGISDSGWFIDKLPSYSDKVDCHDVILCPPQISLKKGMTLWNARLPKNCLNSYPDEPWSCFFGYKIYPTLKNSLFVFQWLFDEAQMLVNNVPTPALKKEEWDYVYKIGDELKKTLINVTNVFIPACMAHTILTHRDWKRVEVNSVYLPRALKCWESGGIVEESNFIPSSRSSHNHWNDEEDTNVNRRNLHLGNRISLQHPHPSMEQSDFPDVVNSNDSRRNRKRHNRHRQGQPNKERRKRRKKLEQDKLKLESSGQDIMPRNAPALNGIRQRQRRRHEGESSDLHRRSNNNSNKNRSSYNSSNISSNRVPRKNSNSNFDSSPKRVEGNHIRRGNRKKQRKRRWFSVCDVGGESGITSGGDIRLIEKCSWPQCNKSCPKLLNPLTGEEVDFKDLLKSFGLDMSTMAKALGIDLATLNQMDHQVLLQMLTQNA